MLKIFSYVMLITCLTSLSAYAETRDILAAQNYLQSGNPDQAITTSKKLLSDTSLNEDERKQLWDIIADAELMITRARHFEDVNAAVEAIETIIKEFPKQVYEPEYIARIIQLYWNQNKLEETQSTLLDLQSRFPGSKEAQQGWLMLGKIHFMNERYADARSAFLRFALNIPRDSAQGRDVRMWTALVDYEEKRFPQAIQVLDVILTKQAKLITSDDNIYSRYIKLLHIQNRNSDALEHADAFLAEFKTSIHSPSIRLLRADLQFAQPNPDIKAVTRAYDLIANQEAATIIGRQAFMRKMMLQIHDKETYHDIKPAIIALKRIANQNQMSEVEDEAFLHEARLWEKVITKDSKNSPKGAGEASLQQFSRATSSTNPKIVTQAKNEGQSSFIRQIGELIQQEEWLSVISLWEKFPNFRPALRQSTQLRFDIAKGLRLLMEYEQAESILTQLHEQAKGSVWGEKVMLERARLWFERRDPKGVEKVLKWLDKHEYTLYRPEMLVIVAHMQIQNKNATAASHTLGFILAEDLSKERKAEYWKVKALTAEAMSRWHVAARAWRMYAKQNISDIDQAHLNEAHVLFKGKDFIPAERLYEKTPESLRDHIWEYRYSICQLKTGKWNQAIERLTALKNDKDGGIYASMAALTLAEREANRLLKENP